MQHLLYHETLMTKIWLSGLLLCGLMLVVSVAESADESVLRNVAIRGSFTNSRLQFEREKKGHVAFIGGSITEMNGYRPMVCDDLKKRFPQTEFTFTDAGISSTCSTTGAFRLQSDVLSKGSVDLIFIEFAVNDDQDAAHARRECQRGLEGILRQCLRHNPKMDIVVTFFVNEGMLSLLQQGKTPVSMGAHAEVTKHYDVATIHLAQEVADRITAGSLTWKVYGGVHPAPAGNRLCADMIDQMLGHVWKTPLAANAAPQERKLPAPLEPGNYGRGGFVRVPDATIQSSWKVGVPDWQKIAGSKRPRFTSLEMLSAEEPGAECTLKFKGSTLGVYVVAGPDAGTLEVSIDGGKFESRDLFHRYSSGLHYPRTVILATDLEDGEHTAVLRVSKDKNEKSSGHAVRIMQFTVAAKDQ